MFGILGGTGLYAIEDLEIKKEHEITTPFGKPSAPVLESYYKENQIFLLDAQAILKLCKPDCLSDIH